ncbi:MAG: hypothetical protein K2M91_11285 [Lachnospiraceae bacterium]|nr:hypothetical protein [Lachnospiraceae bacterium]
MKYNKILLFTTAILLSISIAPSLNVFAKENISNTLDQSQICVPLSEYIEWLYKFEDGKLYRRLFNHSTGEWIGDWELCP